MEKTIPGDGPSLQRGKRRILTGSILIVSLLANVIMACALYKFRTETHRLKAFVADVVPHWLVEDGDYTKSCEALKDYARETALLYMDLYCDGTSKSECDSKAQSDASRLGGAAWTRFVKKQQDDASLRNGDLPKPRS